MIAEILRDGERNAMTGRELAQRCGLDIRTITEQIERERRAGQPICAKTRGERCGYFLAETQEELDQYCEDIRQRAVELFKTRRALLSIKDQLLTGK